MCMPPVSSLANDCLRLGKQLQTPIVLVRMHRKVHSLYTNDSDGDLSVYTWSLKRESGWGCGLDCAPISDGAMFALGSTYQMY